MVARKKGLGKGLEALLGGSAVQNQRASNLQDVMNSEAEKMTAQEQNSAAAAPNINGDVLKQIPLDLCQRGEYQPRKDMGQEALEELAASIKEQGVMQPIILRPLSSASSNENNVYAAQGYEIIAGERRWRASQIAGLDTIPAIVRELSNEEAIAMALIENLQREDLNPIEEAIALDRLQKEFELTHQQVADAVGKSRAAVSNLLRLMNLNKEVKVLLENGDLEMGHARALLSLNESQQQELAKKIVDQSLNVRQTEALVKKVLHPAKAKTEQISTDPNIVRLQTDLSEKIGAVVSIQNSAKNKGKLVIKYNSLDELDGILEHIK